MGSVWWIIGAIFCGTCTVVGSIGNGLTIAIFIAYPKFQNMVGTFIVSLAACDLLFSMFVSSINVYFFSNSGKWYFHKNMCTCYMIICYSLVGMSCLNVCLIALNRCVKICHREDIYQKIFCKRNVIVTFVLVLIYSFGVPVLASFGIGGYIEHNEEAGMCAFKFSGMWISYAGVCAVCMVIIIVCYVRIYVTVVRSRVASKRNSQSASTENTVNYKLLKMLVVTTIIYILSYAIPFTVGLISYFENRTQNHDNSPEQVFWYKVPVYIGVMSNPIVYGITNKMYREAYKKILMGAVKRFYKTTESTQSTTIESTQT